MAGKTFSSSMSAWARANQDRLTAITKQSIQEVVSDAQANIPVDTGFARASIAGSLDGMPGIVADDTASREHDNVTLIIARSKPGDTVFIGYTASYVLPLEYGWSQQAPAGFVRLAAQKWPRIVDSVTAQARSRAG